MKIVFLTLLLSVTILTVTAQQKIIPVIFHILQLGGPENISDAQVLDGIRVLNEDYNKQNADTSLIIPSFKNIAGSMGITFRLANIDPNGNCTNGIERIYSSCTNYGDDAAKIHDWPRDKYLNIWLVYSLGYGSPPTDPYPWQTNLLPLVDGIIIPSDYIGTIGTGSPYSSHSLTQECGKYLGLLYTWGGTGAPEVACGDDSVSDTPITKGWEHCPDTSEAKSCSPSIIENYQNFMEYSYCSCMFTNGQVQRAQSYLNRSAAQRNNLWTIANLIATGTNIANPTPCAPVAGFNVNEQYVCLGEPSTLYDNSYNGIVTSRLWSFQNASVTTSTDSVTSVYFNTPGWHNVTLTVTNNLGNSTIAKQAVFVYDTSVTLHYPYYNNFEDTAQFNNDWASINVDADTAGFQLTNAAGHEDNSSVLLNNFYSRINLGIDELISPAFDLTNIASPSDTVAFWYTYATKPGQVHVYDSIVVYASKDCGSNWFRLYSNANDNQNFENASPTNNYYVPSVGSTLWKRIAAHIPATYATSHTRFMIKVLGTSESNNFYIDDFTIGPLSTSIAQITKLSISVIPNPFNNAITITGLRDEACNISVTDITGKEIFYSNDIQPVSGQLSLNLPVTISKGIYLLKVSGSSSSGTVKLVKQ